MNRFHNYHRKTLCIAANLIIQNEKLYVLIR
uniref:Uncharacterized protein n=1 Tax=Anguilla anguilla TaxID=7936 RepID=A0A0E9T7R6_ANGAN